MPQLPAGCAKRGSAVSVRTSRTGAVQHLPPPTPASTASAQPGWLSQPHPVHAAHSGPRCGLRPAQRRACAAAPQLAQLPVQRTVRGCLRLHRRWPVRCQRCRCCCQHGVHACLCVCPPSPMITHACPEATGRHQAQPSRVEIFPKSREVISWGFVGRGFVRESLQLVKARL